MTTREEALLADAPDYDCGLINDWGGGNVDWWMDYIRDEIGRANEHWRSQIAALATPATAQEELPRMVGARGATIEEMRDNLRAAPEGQTLINAGDCVLMWVNEGDIHNAVVRSIATSATAQDERAAWLREVMQIVRACGYGDAAERIEAAIGAAMPATAQGVEYRSFRLGWDAALASREVDEHMAATAQGDDYVRGWEAGREAAANEADRWATDEQRRFGNGGPAAAIRALTPPAPWQPPPEDQRPEGYRCLGWLDHDIWRGWSVVTWSDGEWMHDEIYMPANPTEFYPLPAPGGQP